MRGSIEIGQSVGPYVVVAQLGRGGMATIYSAYEAGLDREVALKVLPLNLLDQPGFADRFEREARLIARLEHPHIVPLYNYGIDDGVPWMALRLMRGGNLGERLDQGVVSRETGLAYFSMIADALDHAHSLGVVHRDLKPQNVLLGEHGELCLADFGVARLLQGRTMITSTGAVLGTPQYMSPEQAQDERIGPATDIYALGVMAYRWLSGKLPFDADTPYAVMFKHVHAPLSMAALAHLPQIAREVLTRALAKRPEQRWPTAGAFITALGAALYSPGEQPAMDAGPDATTRILPPATAAISSRKLQMTTLSGLLSPLRGGIVSMGKSKRARLVAGMITTGVLLTSVLLHRGVAVDPADVAVEPVPALVPVPAPEIERLPGRLLLDTDMECQLRLNDEPKGLLKPGVPMRLELPPSVYRVACASVVDHEIEIVETREVQSEKLDITLFELQIKQHAKEQMRLETLRRQQAQVLQAELKRKRTEALAEEERKRLEAEMRKRREALMAEEARKLEEVRKAAEARKREEVLRLESAQQALKKPAAPVVKRVAETVKRHIPVPVSTPHPTYPSEALRANITGEVEVEFTVERNGDVSNVRILRARPRGVFERAVMRTVKRWRYQPLDQSVKMTRTIVFR